MLRQRVSNHLRQLRHRPTIHTTIIIDATVKNDKIRERLLEQLKGSVRQIIDERDADRKGKCAYCTEIISLLKDARLTLEERKAVLESQDLKDFCAFIRPEDLSCSY